MGEPAPAPRRSFNAAGVPPMARVCENSLDISVCQLWTRVHQLNSIAGKVVFRAEAIAELFDQ